MSDEAPTESEHPELDRAHAEVAALVDAPTTVAGTPEADRDALFLALARIAKLRGRNFDGREGLDDVPTEGVSAKYLPIIEFANTFRLS